MLRPVETPTREIKKLDGLWAFSLDRENCGIDQRWWESALQESRAIAVPGSFNDQFAGNDSNLLIVFYVQIMPDDFVMQLHRF